MWCSVTNHSENTTPKLTSDPGLESLKESAVNSDPKSLSSAKANWYFGNWEDLASIDLNDLSGHPDFAMLAAFKASGFQQLDDLDSCRKYIQIAKDAGCDNRLLSTLLLAGVHNILGRMAALNNNDEKMLQHFKSAVNADVSKEGKLVYQARSIKELSSVGLLPQAAKLLEQEKNSLNGKKFSAKEYDAKIKILETEIEIINHELSLAHQKNQLYSTQGKAESIYLEDGSINIERLRQLSTSQLGQDLWALEKSKYKTGGFFVEFGATDGVLLSNTYLLEKEFGWNGICAEPNPKYFKNLSTNRSCITSPSCISDKTGQKVTFILANEFGGIESSVGGGMHKEKIEAFKSQNECSIELETLSLHDFLIKNNAPRSIDYLSIDTEGSEFSILSSLPFDHWDIKLITVEHNYEEQRAKLFNLLTSKGYLRIEAQWDDWYYKS